MHHIQFIRGKLHFICKLLHRLAADCNFKSICVFRSWGIGSSGCDWIGRWSRLRNFLFINLPFNTVHMPKNLLNLLFFGFVYHNHITVAA